jgi:hypothetical protein
MEAILQLQPHPKSPEVWQTLTAKKSRTQTSNDASWICCHQDIMYS